MEDVIKETQIHVIKEGEYRCLECPLLGLGGFCLDSPEGVGRVAPTIEEAAKQGSPNWCPRKNEIKEV